MRRSRRPSAAVHAGACAATLALAVTLTGCGPESSSASDDPSASPSTSASASVSSPGSASASPSESGSASGSADPSPSRYAHNQPTKLPYDRLSAASFHVAALQSSVASTAEEKAVVNSWMHFWQAASDTYYYGQPAKALSVYSTGEARRGILDYLAQQKHDKERVVGWARDNVTSVKIDGERAVVRDCTRNFTYSTDLEGEPQSHPDKWYDATGVLQKQGGRWVVVSQKSPARKTSCLS
jgi:hypothetical protein